MAETYSLRQVVTGHCIDGRYEIVRELGSGGMSVVFLAKHLHLGRQVAIKFIRKELLRAEHADHNFAERFKREGRVMARIEHPNCIRIHDLGALGDGTQFMVMEYFRGQTIADLLDDAPEGLDQAYMLDLAVQMTSALVAVHAADVTHYDLKPENVMVGTEADGVPHVKLLDFGIAKIRSPDDEGPPAGAGHLRVVAEPKPKQLTVALSVLGTPEYMSPEAASGLRISAHADLYSLGAVFFHMLTGVTPYQPSEEQEDAGPHAVAMSLMMQHVQSPVPSVLSIKPTIDPELAELIQSLMAKAPNERPTAAELLPRLQKIRARLREPKSAPVGARIKSATIALVGGVVELDRALKEQAVQRKLAVSDTSELGAPQHDTMLSPSFVERWGPWVRERLQGCKQAVLRARMLVIALLVLGASVWAGSQFKKTGTRNPDTEHEAVPVAVVTAQPILSRSLEDAMTQQLRRNFEATAPSYNPPPQVVVVAEVVEPVVPVPQPPPEVVVEPPQVPTPKPKPQPKKANAAQLFQQASSAFGAGNKKMACSLAKRAIAAADSAKANALRKAASRFECGSL